MKLVKESKPKNDVFHPIYNKKIPKLKGVKIRKVCPRTPLQSMSPKDGSLMRRCTVDLRRSILSIFSKTALCIFSDLIDGPTTRSVNALTVHRCLSSFHT